MVQISNFKLKKKTFNNNKVVGSTYQLLDAPNPATYLGSGKVRRRRVAIVVCGCA